MKLQPIQQNFTQSSEHLIPEQTIKDNSFWGRDGFTFGDVLDMFNPLQHLPVVSKFYRESSQDDCCEGSKLIGGILFGGLMGGVSGVISSIANSAIRHETSQDVSEHLIAMVDDSLSDFADSPQTGDQVAEILNPQALQIATNHESNPFFAQLLESVTDEQIYTSTTENTSHHRIREWGKV